MTGIDKTEAQKFIGIYNTGINVVPTNKPIKELVHSDLFLSIFIININDLLKN